MPAPIQRPAPAPARLLAASLLAGLALPSCALVDVLGVVRVPESNDWNLSQLHKPSGAYNFTADLVTDLQYLVRSGAGKLPVQTQEINRLGNKKKVVRDPAEATLENVLELASFDPDGEYVAGLQALWYCRLTMDDPSALVRERCVLELGGLGERVDIGPPQPLPEGARPAGPDELGDPLTALIRAFRLTRESGPEASAAQGELVAACRALQALTLDVQGGRRVLYTTGQLLRSVKERDPARAPLESLSRHVQRASIEQALAKGLVDEAPFVRAAAVEATVRASGTEVLGQILLQLQPITPAIVVVRVVDMVSEFGLPGPPPGMAQREYVELREVWLERLYEIAVNHPEGHLRVHAMRALAAVADPGVESLREEDWERWWLARPAPLADEGRGT